MTDEAEVLRRLDVALAEGFLEARLGLPGDLTTIPTPDGPLEASGRETSFGGSSRTTNGSSSGSCPTTLSRCTATTGSLAAGGRWRSRRRNHPPQPPFGRAATTTDYATPLSVTEIDSVCCPAAHSGSVDDADTLTITSMWFDDGTCRLRRSAART